MAKGKEPEKMTQQGRKKIPSLHAIRKPGQRTLPWPEDLSTAPYRKADTGKPGPSITRKIVEIERDDRMEENDEMEDEIYSQPTIDGTCLE